MSEADIQNPQTVTRLSRADPKQAEKGFGGHMGFLKTTASRSVLATAAFAATSAAAQDPAAVEQLVVTGQRLSEQRAIAGCRPGRIPVEPRKGRPDNLRSRANILEGGERTAADPRVSADVRRRDSEHRRPGTHCVGAL
jgi:hypothetical protein